MANASGKKTSTAQKKKKADPQSKKKKGGLFKGLKRITILIVATCIVFGVGMAKYNWKPFGLAWEDFAGHSISDLPGNADEALDRARRSAQDSMNGVRNALTDTSEQKQNGEEDDLTEEDRKAKEEMLRRKGL